MNIEIPKIIELLYYAMVTGPNPGFWPEHLKKDPVMGHGLWCFYSGISMGLQLGSASFELF
ncbi:hypothetical protein D1646_00705 [Pseudoflavonifractor sp. 60]|uniref:hypothetical protein n=1 Tax=Pseudoflavonifractor sp. 60 TaxID=2304576 RepID=UPI00136DB68F|nr:hypothetical protein [Pseudoflavonifractor sp. 60]NBI65349.1 hypothetical protein [Pseudoflavonifractor sp. 60]